MQTQQERDSAQITSTIELTVDMLAAEKVEPAIAIIALCQAILHIAWHDAGDVGEFCDKMKSTLEYVNRDVPSYMYDKIEESLVDQPLGEKIRVAQALNGRGGSNIKLHRGKITRIEQ